MKRSFSGIQPTGDIHIGNYLGAIKTWVEMLDKYECFFCIVDLHALTIKYDVAEMARRTLDAVAVNIACGLEPEKCTIFVQSHVPEHSELCWILDTVTPMGELGRMTQFKEKSRQNVENVNVGLFNYPVLQAADILLYKGEVVPVGEDQVQHIEFAREVARKFNAAYGDVFPEPQALLSKAARVVGLDGSNKMSKSLGNHIAIADPPGVIRKKLATATTDPARKRRTDPGEPAKCNIYSLHEFFSTPEQIRWVEEGCRSAGIGCLDCKKVLADNIIAALEPIQSRYAELTADMTKVERVVADGAEHARGIASGVMTEVRDALGLYVGPH
ncbi:MAG: tryptophan--tRNA ligase [Planctomycetota bacterium]